MVIIQMTEEQLMERLADVVDLKYDPVFGFTREQMMKKLKIKSDTTFYDRLRKGKIISKEVGGSIRYFLP